MSNKSIVDVQEQAPQKEKKPRSEKQQLNDKKLKEKFETYHKNKREERTIIAEQLSDTKDVIESNKKPSTYKKNNKKFPATFLLQMMMLT